jgi:hypothetical protein
MQNGAPLVFLFVRGLTMILLLGALGVQGQQKDLRQVPIFFNVTSFTGNGPKGKENS